MKKSQQILKEYVICNNCKGSGRVEDAVLWRTTGRCATRDCDKCYGAGRLICQTEISYTPVAEFEMAWRLKNNVNQD